MAVGLELASLAGYPFEVRHSEGSVARAAAAADVAADAFAYFRGLFGVQPDLALIVAAEADWSGKQPYGLPFFRDATDELRPGIVLMPAGGGTFWTAIVDEIREASADGYAMLRAVYPDGGGEVDLQPFFDLITIHELGHAFEVLGDLRLPTFWLSEIFVNLAMHAFVATHRPAALPTLETLPTVGVGSAQIAARWRAHGYSTLEGLQAHYTGGGDSMDPLNYIWYQHRWLRLVAELFDVDGEDGLVRFWNCFHGADRAEVGASAATLAPLLATEVSPTLARAVREWR